MIWCIYIYICIGYGVVTKASTLLTQMKSPHDVHQRGYTRMRQTTTYTDPAIKGMRQKDTSIIHVTRRRMYITAVIVPWKSPGCIRTCIRICIWCRNYVHDMLRKDTLKAHVTVHRFMTVAATLTMYQVSEWALIVCVCVCVVCVCVSSTIQDFDTSCRVRLIPQLDSNNLWTSPQLYIDLWL